MGWYFPHRATREDVIAEVTRGALDSQVIFDTVYSLHEYTHPATGETGRLIAVTLIEAGDGGWGYKPMDESMGPYRFDCPRRILEAATEPPNDCARDWRAACRGEHTERFGGKS